MVVNKLLNEFSEDVLRAYIQENSDYYLTKWKEMSQRNVKTSWNWAAFFLGGWWMG